MELFFSESCSSQNTYASAGLGGGPIFLSRSVRSRLEATVFPEPDFPDSQRSSAVLDRYHLAYCEVLRIHVHVSAKRKCSDSWVIKGDKVAKPELALVHPRVPPVTT